MRKNESDNTRPSEPYKQGMCTPMEALQSPSLVFHQSAHEVGMTWHCSAKRHALKQTNSMVQ